MNKCILLIDMDGVLCDWVGGFLKMWRQKYPDRTYCEVKDQTTFWLEGTYPEEYHADIQAIKLEAGLYSSLETFPEAITALKDIESNCLDFIEPFICSAPEARYESQLSHSEKAQWAEKNLGPFWTKRMILTRDKTLVRGHLLIDDKPNIQGCMTPSWIQLVKDQPWNRHLPSDNRFDWSEWETLRETIKAQFTPKQESSILLLN